MTPLVSEVRAESVDDDGRSHGDIEAVQVGVRSSVEEDTHRLPDIRQDLSGDAAPAAESQSE